MFPVFGQPMANPPAPYHDGNAAAPPAPYIGGNAAAPPAPYVGGNAAGQSAPYTSGNAMAGIVKSWNGSKGYGFITAEGVAGDIMFLRSELPVDAKEVRGKFLEGKTVKFEIQAGNAGKAQATKISIAANEGDFMAGVIKSYSDKHGYGFIASSMCPGSDIRFNRQDFDALMPGANLRDQLVIFQTQLTPDGKLRASKIMFQSNKIAQNFKMTSMMGFGKGGFGGYGGYGFAKGGMGGYGGMPGMGGMGGYGGKGGFDRPKISVSSTGQRANGVVKSYNTSRGFGFITCPGSPADVFFMRTDLPEAARASNVQNCSVNFEVMRTSDGKLRAASINTF